MVSRESLGQRFRLRQRFSPRLGPWRCWLLAAWRRVNLGILIGLVESFSRKVSFVVQRTTKSLSHDKTEADPMEIEVCDHTPLVTPNLLGIVCHYL